MSYLNKGDVTHQAGDVLKLEDETVCEAVEQACTVLRSEEAERRGKSVKRQGDGQTPSPSLPHLTSLSLSLTLSLYVYLSLPPPPLSLSAVRKSSQPGTGVGAA